MTEEKYSDPISELGKTSKLKLYWSRLDHNRQKQFVVGGVMVAFFLICFIGYSIKETGRQDDDQPRKAAPEVKDIALDKFDRKGIERAQLMSAKASMDALREEVQQDLENIKKEAAAAAVQQVKDNEEKNADNAAIAQKSTKGLQGLVVPPPPQFEQKTPQGLFAQTPPPPPNGAKATARKLGGIRLVKAPVSETKADDKKKSQSAFLSPSFMEVVTLSGMAAPTTSAGKNSPLPIFLRIKAPAFLPNEVRSKLTGCFIFGEGIGDLASERIHVRLKTLSCVSKNNSAVINEEIKGFITDADGRVGLRGRVVAKLGLHAARAAFASFIEAAGEAFGTSTKTISVGTSGLPMETMTDTDMDAILAAGVGAGIADGAKQMKQLYVQLMEQTLPVIEVGSMKKCTAVVSDAVELKIQEQNIF